MFENLFILNLHFINGSPIREGHMSGRKLIPFGQRMTEFYLRTPTLAQARCQNAGTASRDYIFNGLKISSDRFFVFVSCYRIALIVVHGSVIKYFTESETTFKLKAAFFYNGLRT